MVSLVMVVLVARHKFGFMFDFSGLFWGARIFSGFLKRPSFIPFTCYNLCFLFLKTGKLPVFPQKAGRTSSLLLYNIRSQAGGGRTVKCCVTKLCLTSHELGVFIMLWDFSVVSFENSGQWFLWHRRITRSMRAVLKIPAAFLQRENNV